MEGFHKRKFLALLHKINNIATWSCTGSGSHTWWASESLSHYQTQTWDLHPQECWFRSTEWDLVAASTRFPRHWGCCQGTTLWKPRTKLRRAVSSQEGTGFSPVSIIPTILYGSPVPPQFQMFSSALLTWPAGHLNLWPSLHAVSIQER